MSINPLDLLLWTFRRNETDVVKLYDALSPVMEVSTGGDMLNFGFWNDSISHPVDAQKKLCTLMGNMAELDSAHIITCLLYTSPSPRDVEEYRMPSSA